MSSALVIHFFECIGIFMCLYFLLQFIILKKVEYLYYAIYLSLLVLYYLCAVPEVFSFIQSPQPPQWLEVVKRPVQFLTSVFYTLFIIHYLSLEKQSMPLYRIFKFLIGMYALFALACLLFNIFKVPYNNVYYILSLLLFPVQLYMVSLLFKYRVRYGAFVIWGSANLIVGSVCTLILGIMMANNPAGSITNAGSYIPVIISIITDIFLFTIALQRKVADTEKSLINAAIARQQAVAAERERIITDLHDDVGGGLSSIRMMSDLMALQQPSSGEADASTSFPAKISATARDISQRMNTIIWSLNTENDSLQNFAEYVRQHGITYFENSPIRFHYHQSPDLPAHLLLSGGHRKNLFLIVKESLHNILKHAGATVAEVSISLQQQMLTITIKDNGKGLQKENDFGNGLKNMQKRMHEINGSFAIQSANGTVVTVSVQL